MCANRVNRNSRNLIDLLYVRYTRHARVDTEANNVGNEKIYY